MATNASEAGRSLIKQLAFTQKSSREKALKLVLKSWLPSRSEQLPEEDAKKLWKGLFYCVWHSDKPLVQADLIDRLASLLLTLHSSFTVQYFSTFFLTMRREWSGIDALRLDKFYLLIRRFVSKSFSLMNKNSWDLEFVKLIVNCLDDATFASSDKLLQGKGVNYHVASVFLDELTPFLPVKVSVLEVLFKPFFTVVGKLPDKVLLGKIKIGLFDVLLKNGKKLLEIKKSGGDEVADGDIVNLGTIALGMGFASKLFELGSAPDCVQGNRKILFEMHREFLQLEKDAVNSGFEFSVPDSVDRDDEEVPDLVPIVEVDADVVQNGKLLKKCKKEKKGSVDKAKKEKKSKKKNKKSDASGLSSEMNSAENGDKNAANENGGNSIDEVVLTESVISNLQKQFEKVAAEAGLEDGVASLCATPKAAGDVSKKRKRTKNSKGKTSQDFDLNGGDAEDSAVAKSGDKSSKKVRFSMKNNLVWKPHSPLPPQSLRIPPSVTPRGSALKQGVPPGPIREMPLQNKKAKLKKAGRRTIIGVVPSVKRMKKLRSLSV
ncbi:putative nucleolar, Nop52 [Medicago truncatula]|uniref:Nucleolar protein,Nop52 protein n=1 Tax=Medicago truncatula TaxID=3880 RepID=G7JKJ1_MEDTR|nr:ribosomal RNA processing protein 1 homolog B [Medicago truncatula]AES92718.1 nucleolar protein,Nop52 protein [Medicago truncatula]RHN65050.1 putative nucleolar, Nop52 [Medicago truncatula]